MGTHNGIPNPSSWVQRFLHLLPKRAKVLDLACGSGRHTRLLLDHGCSVVAVDRDLSGVADVSDRPHLILIQFDLEAGEDWPLAGQTFDAIVVTNYLCRELFPGILWSLRPGGLLIYETFAVGNERLGKPKNPDFLLREGELQEVVKGKLDVIEYEHVEVTQPKRAVVQRICARRPG